MCLTTPFEVKKVKDGQAELSDGRMVNIVLISGVKAGDWVLANADLVVSKVSQQEAKEIKEILNNR